MVKRSSAKSSSETSKVKAVNLAYYKALSARDLRSMEAVWTCAADNILIAPPVNPHSHVGWARSSGTGRPTGQHSTNSACRCE